MGSLDLCRSKSALDHCANCCMSTSFRLTFWALFWGLLSGLERDWFLTGNTFLPGWNAFLWWQCKKEDGYLNNTGSCRGSPESMYCIAVRSLVSAPTSWSSLTKATALVIFRSEMRFFSRRHFACLLCLLSENSLEMYCIWTDAWIRIVTPKIQLTFSRWLNNKADLIFFAHI